MKTIVVNAVGDRCPIPVVKTLKAMSALTEPSVIEVLVDDVIPVQNLTRLAEGKGLPCASEALADGRYAVRMEVADPAALQAGGEVAACCPEAGENIVVAIASERMGHGDNEHNLVAVHCEFYGKTVFSRIAEAYFEDCTFGYNTTH